MTLLQEFKTILAATTLTRLQALERLLANKERTAKYCASVPQFQGMATDELAALQKLVSDERELDAKYQQAVKDKAAAARVGGKQV
jgi:hypothetical protein